MIRKINEIGYIDNVDTVPVIRFTPFDRFGWLNCGFSTRIGGVSTGCHESLNLGFERGDNRENVIENFRRFGESAGFDPHGICLPSQWHTNNIRIAREEHICGENYEKRTEEPVDGQITNCKNIVLLAYGADCAPIYLVDPENKAIGLCHSGWKGTLNAISKDALELMNKEYGTVPEDIVAVIGPSISSDNYEVGADVADHFIDRFEINVTNDSSVVKKGAREGKCQLDLWEANRLNLIEAGVKPENIFISGICTFKKSDLMYSHRRMGNERGVMAGFLEMIG